MQFTPPPFALQGTFPAPQPRLPQTMPAPKANPQWAAGNANRPAAPKPVIRAQAEDPPAPPSRLALRLPSPEDLGIAIAKVAPAEIGFDERLQRLGATRMKVEQLAQGGYRAHFVLPGARTVEAEGNNRDVALNLALDRAELSVRP